jgi:hypothetical protein
MRLCLIIYLVLFVAPMMAITILHHHDFSEDPSSRFRPNWLIVVLLFTMMGAQVFFVLIEVVQMSTLGKKYISDQWNQADLLQLVVFVSFFSIEVHGFYQGNGSPVFTQTLLKFALSILIFAQILYFLRSFESYAFLVKMLFQTFVKTK